MIYSHPSLPGRVKETPLEMGISFIPVNVPYKRVTFTLLSDLLLCLPFLKIILVAKKGIWGWHIPPSSGVNTRRQGSWEAQ